MLGKLRSHVAANVVGYLALFVALGGTTYAAATITGADVVDESLTGADVRGKFGTSSTPAVNGTLGTQDIGGQQANPLNGTPFIDGSLTQWDIKNGTLGTDDVANNSLTGADIDEGTLVGGPGSPSGPAGGDLTGTYPNPQIRSAASGSDDVNADKLDNLDSTQLSPVTGDGRTADLALNFNSQSVLSANITTARPASLLVSAAVNLGGGGAGGARVYCDLLFDGAISSVEYGTNHGGGAAEETLPVVWAQGVGAGAHTVVLRCRVPVGLSSVLNAGMNVSAHV